MSADRVARAGLSGVSEPGDVAVAADVALRGAPAVWAERVAAGADAELPLRHLERLDALRGRLLIPGDAEWPPLVDRLATAVYDGNDGLREPLALWVRGPLSLAAAGDRAVAVVGSRAATGYGAHVAAELGTGLALRGSTVVSGAAFGIDGAAHRGSLAGGGPTVAVLASGVDMPYPRRHEGLLDAIRTEGAVVSEVPPGYAPFRQRFLRRNRLIAGLAQATVLVEAGARSGALNTARHARAITRPLLAVPGPVTSVMSVGCHRLIVEGKAVLVTGVDDVLRAGLPTGQLGLPLPAGSTATSPRDGLAAEVARLLDAVPSRSPAPLDRIASIAGVAVRTAMVELSCLEEAGLVELVGAGWRLTALGRS